MYTFYEEAGSDSPCGDWQLRALLRGIVEKFSCQDWYSI